LAAPRLNSRDARSAVKRTSSARTFSGSLAQVNETNAANSEVCVLEEIGKCSA